VFLTISLCIICFAAGFFLAKFLMKDLAKVTEEWKNNAEMHSAQAKKKHKEAIEFHDMVSAMIEQFAEKERAKQKDNMYN